MIVVSVSCARWSFPNENKKKKLAKKGSLKKNYKKRKGRKKGIEEGRLGE